MSSSDVDFQLLKRYRDTGDEEAFADIVRLYAGVVFSTCRRILGDNALAEEVTQETFFRLVQRRNEIRESIGGWLHRVATTLAIDVARSESSRRKRERICSSQEPIIASEWAELSPLIDEALAELPPESRDLLVQRFLRGRTQTELAEERGTSQATLSRQVSNGIEDLRKILRNKGIAVGTTALIFWMRDQTMGQASAALIQQLGKISLVSKTGLSTASNGLIAKCLAAVKASTAGMMISNNMALLVVVLVSGILIGWSSNDFRQSTTNTDNPAGEQTEDDCYLDLYDHSIFSNARRKLTNWLLQQQPDASTDDRSSSQQP